MPTSNTPSFEAIIFDLDGTIIDTEPAASQALRECFQEWNLVITMEDANSVTGRTWGVTFEELFPKYPVPIDKKLAEQVILDRYHAILQNNLPVVPGAVEAIEHLYEHFPLALVSGSLNHQIVWALDHLEIRDRFKLILGGDEYPRSKPAPDGYIQAMRELDVDPKRTLIFEDSTAGVASGLASGAWVVAVTGTHTFPHQIEKAHAKIPHFQGITRGWIEEFGRNHLKR